MLGGGCHTAALWPPPIHTVAPSFPAAANPDNVPIVLPLWEPVYNCVCLFLSLCDYVLLCFCVETL